MAVIDKEKLIKELSKKLDHHRFVHTLGVAYTATNLAYRYDIDSEKAFLAGILHDCAKCMSPQENVEYCKKHNIELSAVEIANPGLAHAKAGVLVAKKDYDIKDEEILEAIRWHTTGKPKMTPLEEIIFISDYIEPNRDHDPELNLIRNLAYTDKLGCLIKIYEHSLNHIKGSNKQLDETTVESYEYYKSIKE